MSKVSTTNVTQRTVLNLQWLHSSVSCQIQYVNCPRFDSCQKNVSRIDAEVSWIGKVTVIHRQRSTSVQQVLCTICAQVTAVKMLTPLLFWISLTAVKMCSSSVMSPSFIKLILIYQSRVVHYQQILGRLRLSDSCQI